MKSAGAGCAELVAGTSVAAARRLLAGRFRAAGLDSPELDARLIVGHALDRDHAGLAAAADERLSADAVDRIAALAARRLRREPVARIVGTKEFWGLSLQLGAATLVPRPETETVVEAALAAVRTRRAQPLRILDLGTGSGALLLALLHELPNAWGIGTDLSAAALAVARRNAAAVGVSKRAAFVGCDLAAALNATFDLIVSNPPYIASGDIAHLAPEVQHYDPRAALDGGPDGLACYRAIAVQAPALLRPGGRLVVELGAGQAKPVESLFRAAGLPLQEVLEDLAGVTRALVAEAPGHA